MKAIKAKPLKGYGGASVLEVVTDHDGNTYRAVYIYGEIRGSRVCVARFSEEVEETYRDGEGTP